MNGSDPVPQETPPQEVVTLFLIVVDPDGSSRAVLNTEERFMAQRIATPKDVYPALANVLADFQGLKTAEAMFSFQMQMARSSQEASQAAGQSEET
jgi:ubiquinone biosynthesis protein Coq4